MQSGLEFAFYDIKYIQDYLPYISGHQEEPQLGGDMVGIPYHLILA